jgi:hypothetical protein
LEHRLFGGACTQTMYRVQAINIPGGVARYSDLAAAIGRRRLRTAIETGALRQPWRGVVIRSDCALDLWTRAAAALLVIGDHAALCGATAVALHGCDAAASTDIHVAVPCSRLARSRPGLVVRQRRYTADDVVGIDGLPVFALDLALADYLCTADKRAGIASLDQALAGRDSRGIAAVKAGILRRLAARVDPRGVAKATALVELATGRAESPPESIFRLIVVEAGFPAPEPQCEIRTVDGELLYLLDMAWKRLRIALEYDGYAAHEARAGYDAERDRRLQARGWIVVRARAADLKDPGRILAELRSAFAQRSR